MSFKTIKKPADYKLPDAPVKGIILHWSAGHYHQPFADYHYCIDADGSVLQNSAAPPGVWTSHCWHRNTGNIGIAALAMVGATEGDYGDEPITRYQIEAMAALSAKLMRRYGIPLESVLTHAEAAALDGYGPGSGDPETRWDLWHEGAELKKKIEWYLKQH